MGIIPPAERIVRMTKRNLVLRIKLEVVVYITMSLMRLISYESNEVDKVDKENYSSNLDKYEAVVG